MEDRHTTLFECETDVRVSDMHIMCDPDQKTPMTKKDFRQMGLKPEEYNSAMWNLIDGVHDYMYTIIFKNKEDFKPYLHCLKSVKEGVIHAFFDYRDLKVFVIKNVLKKHAILS